MIDFFLIFSFCLIIIYVFFKADIDIIIIYITYTRIMGKSPNRLEIERVARRSIRPKDDYVCYDIIIIYRYLIILRRHNNIIIFNINITLLLDKYL